jgi:hypothetical protein
MVCAECGRALEGGPCTYCGSELVAYADDVPAVIDYREIEH